MEHRDSRVGALCRLWDAQGWGPGNHGAEACCMCVRSGVELDVVSRRAQMGSNYELASGFPLGLVYLFSAHAVVLMDICGLSTEDCECHVSLGRWKEWKIVAWRE